jgi:phosphotransferase system  glucose/maltose/N-acetylglucosamine-specific IIC component
MNAALALILFLLGALGVVVLLFTSLRQHSSASEGVLAGALFMLIPVVTADLLWLRWVLGIACFALWLLLAVYWMNFRHLNRNRGKRRSR